MNLQLPSTPTHSVLLCLCLLCLPHCNYGAMSKEKLQEMIDMDPIELARKLTVLKEIKESGQELSIEDLDNLLTVKEIAILDKGNPVRERLIAMKIFRAVLADDAGTVDEVLERYGDKYVHGTVPGNEEPLVCAALLYNRLDILKVLLAHGASLDHRGRDGLSLLDNAVMFGYVPAAEWLLEMGVGSYLKEMDSDNPTPLHTAANFANRQMVEMLLAKGPWGVNELAHETEWTPLHSLAMGDPDARRFLSEYHTGLMKHRKPKNPPPAPDKLYDAKGTAEALLAAGADMTITGRRWVGGLNKGTPVYYRLELARPGDPRRAAEELRRRRGTPLPRGRSLLHEPLHQREDWRGRAAPCTPQRACSQGRPPARSGGDALGAEDADREREVRRRHQRLRRRVVEDEVEAAGLQAAGQAQQGKPEGEAVEEG